MIFSCTLYSFSKERTEYSGRKVVKKFLDLSMRTKRMVIKKTNIEIDIIKAIPKAERVRTSP